MVRDGDDKEKKSESKPLNGLRCTRLVSSPSSEPSTLVLDEVDNESDDSDDDSVASLAFHRSVAAAAGKHVAPLPKSGNVAVHSHLPQQSQQSQQQNRHHRQQQQQQQKQPQHNGNHNKKSTQQHHHNHNHQQQQRYPATNRKSKSANNCTRAPQPVASSLKQCKSLARSSSAVASPSRSKLSANRSTSRIRNHPLKYKTKLPNQNLPFEASCVVDSNQRNHHHSDNHCTTCDTFELNESAIYTAKVREEFEASNVELLATTNSNPEPFLVPVPHPGAGSFLDRRIDPNKLITFLVRHMRAYYDLSTDPDAFSRRRMAMDDLLWDNVAYLIPILCRQLVELLRNDPIVVTVSPDAIVFGDIHGNFNDIYFIYSQFISNPQYAAHRFVFLGDYVDRGPKPVEILCLLFALKLADPRRFVLLRGNHEVPAVNRKYGFRALCSHIFVDTYIKHRVLGKLIYESFNRVFTYMPLAAVIKSSASSSSSSSSVFLCHGGVPNQRLKRTGHRDTPWTIAELNALSSAYHPAMLAPTRHASAEHRALNELLWNDPMPARLRRHSRFRKKLFYRNKKRGGHCSFFTEAGLVAFLEANRLSMMIRGHQFKHCKKRGYHRDFDDRLLTLFSSSNYCGTQRNVTSYALVSGPDCHVRPNVLRTIEEAAIFADFNLLKMTIDKKTNDIDELVF